MPNGHREQMLYLESRQIVADFFREVVGEEFGHMVIDAHPFFGYGQTDGCRGEALAQ